MPDDNKIVGHCKDCGAPIYGKECCSGSCTPRPIYSCNCRNKPKDTKASGDGMVKYGSQ